MITSRDEFIAHVVEEYQKCDTELNGLFFNFDVQMTEADIITGYAHLQHVINGDTVFRKDGGRIVDWDDENFIPKDGGYDQMFYGNAMDYLEGYNWQHSNIFGRYAEEEEVDFIP